MPNFDNTLQQQALADLTSRAKGGIVLYLLVWLVVGMVFQLPDTSPVFFYFNLLIFAVIAVFRGLHLIWVARRPNEL